MIEPSDPYSERKLFGVPAWRWSALSHLTGALGVIGLVFGIVQYVHTIEANRAEKTIGMIDDWVDGGYREAFLALAKSTQAAIDSVQSALPADSSDARAFDKVRSQIVYDVLATEGGDSHFDQVIYYFNRLGLCVEADVCSDRTAQIFFDDTLEDFLSIFQGEINARRERFQGYAEGLTLLHSSFQ